MKFNVKRYGTFSLGMIFTVLLISQFMFYNRFQSIEEVKIRGSYTDQMTVYYGADIKIVKPLQSELSEMPAVILLHGDNSFSNFLTFLKLEFLKNNYIVALINVIDYSLPTFFVLNDTLDYLLERDDVNKSQIGIFGHSHGGHYSLLFSSMRNNSISSTICANFGPLSFFYNDFYIYYRLYIAHNLSLPSRYHEFLSQNGSLEGVINFEGINNLLLITDSNDSIPDENLSNYLYNFTGGQIFELNSNFGEFVKGSARKMYVTSTIFGHASSIFHPSSIYESISWINLSFGLDLNKSNLINIRFEVAIGLSLFIMQLIIAFFWIRRYMRNRHVTEGWSEIFVFIIVIPVIFAIGVTIYKLIVL